MSQPADAVNPSTLWHQADKEHPTDAAARTARYLDLMREHGHLIPRDELDDTPLLPCGWPTSRDPIDYCDECGVLIDLHPDDKDGHTACGEAVRRAERKEKFHAD